MIKQLKRNLFPLLIAFSALSVSVSAGFYSISGLSKLFAGASFEVIVMAASLEVAKLVIASLLYQYWSTLNKYLRTYLSIATVVLVLITSMGIYGFLSAAYQETANKAGNIDTQVALIEVKRDNIKEQLNVYTSEKKEIAQSITSLRSGLANNVIQYIDKEGNKVTTTSSATRKALEKQLDQAIERQTSLNSKVDDLNETLFLYETEIVEIKTNSEIAGELGPLKYLSGLTGAPMDKIINILLLVIIFVFDPLAISLVIAANFAFNQAKPKKNLYGELEDWVEVDIDKLWDDSDEDHALDQVLNTMVEDIEVIDPETVEVGNKDKEWVIVDEDEPIRVIKVLEQNQRNQRVLYSNGTTQWVPKPNPGEENTIRYL